jgi:NADH pyrophosphatase NudC (nudix superfamily)
MHVEAEDELASAQWAALTEVLDRVEPQRIARRSHREILEEVRGFRESE